MGYKNPTRPQAVCNACTHYKQLMSIHIYRECQKNCVLSKLRFTYYNVQYDTLFKVVCYGVTAKSEFLLITGNAVGAS